MDSRLAIYDLRCVYPSVRRIGYFAVCLLCAVQVGGCSRPQRDISVPAAHGADREGERAKTTDDAASNPPSAIRHPQLAAGFAPAKVSVLPLTELSVPAGTGSGATLTVYVALLDAFGVQIKAPGVLRFELYDYVPRSAEPKGQRIAIWPDIDLTRPADNHKYWRDFLRAYEFAFELQADRTKPCILEVTCISPDGRRLSGEYVLKGAQT